MWNVYLFITSNNSAKKGVARTQTKNSTVDLEKIARPRSRVFQTMSLRNFGQRINCTASLRWGDFQQWARMWITTATKDTIYHCHSKREKNKYTMMMMMITIDQ